SAVTALRNRDLQAAFGFLREAEAVTGPSPFTPELLERLRQLVPCDLVNFCELDHVQHRVIADVASDPGCADDADCEEVAAFWRLRHQHPVCAYRDRTGDFSARKVTDFLTRRQLDRLELFAGAGRSNYEIGVGFPAPPWHTK